jgi:hypothetical protein
MSKLISSLFIGLVAISLLGAGQVVSNAGHRAVKAAKSDSPKPAAATTPTPDPRIVVYVFAFATPSPSASLTVSGTDAAVNLATAIDKLSVYRGCYAKPSGDNCPVDRAAILVHGTVDANGNATATSATYSDAGGFRAIGSLPSTDISKPEKLDFKALSPLLGKAIVQEGNLVVAPGGYQEFLQLVPGTVNAGDPDYATLLQFLLSQRGIRSFRSQMTLGAVGSNTGAQPCTQGEEYFVYSIDTGSTSHPLIGTTRLGVNVFGALLNCNAPSQHVSFSGEASKNIPTTKSSVLSYTSLIALGLTKFNWTSINAGLGLAAGFADTDPKSVDARGSVAEAALRDLIHNFCLSLPSPTPTPKAQARTIPSRSPSLTTNTATIPFDPSSIPGTEPYEPACGPEPMHTPTAGKSIANVSRDGRSSAKAMVQGAETAFHP